MSVTFNLVPANIRVPGMYSEIDNSQAVSGAGLIDLKILLLGQLLAAGTADSLVPVRITSVAQARTLFGAGSMLAIMAEAAIASNGYSELWCLPIDDNGAGVLAAGSIAFSGTPTESGTINFYIGGKVVQVAVTTASTGASLATAMAAAINADTTLPVTAAVDGVLTAQVNITARNKGENGNGIDLRMNYNQESTPAGLATTIVAMSAGATNPVLTDAIAALGDMWFHIWGQPYADTANLTLIEAELVSRFGPMREIEAHAFSASRGTVGTLGTLGESRNSPHQTIVAAAYEPMPPWAKAAETAAIVAYAGSNDPARPFQTLTYTYCKPAAEADRFTLQENNILLYDGIATTYVDAGGIMRVQRLITTYRENAAGGEDESYLDSETLLTLMTIRHDWRNYITSKYPRHKVANDGTRFGPGQSVVTPNTIKAEAVSKFREWESLGLVENFDQFKADLIVERNASDVSRIDVVLPPDIINGLRIIGTKISFRL